MLELISYNVNGIRAAQRKGFEEWVSANNYGIICLQETKARPTDLELKVLDTLGYEAHWHSAEKKGYSGVAVFSKIKPDLVVEGCGIERFDSEGRIIRLDFGDWTLLNCYFPSGSSGDARQAVKMDFLGEFMDFVDNLKKERPKLIIVGDYNIAHTEMDIHNPKSNKKSSGFLPEERAWMTEWFESGFTDSFRHKHPDMEEYSWWSYRANARANNKGWRIDYISVTDNMQDAIVDARQLNDVKHSDHCPVWVQLDME